MPVTLRPTTGRGGVIRWDRFSVFLHLLLFWQFGVACLLNFWGMMLLAFDGFGGRPRTGYWDFFVLSNLLLTITIISEVCVFANEALTPNKYLCFEVSKTTYITVVFIIAEISVSWGTELWCSAIFLLPYNVTTVYAIAIKYQQWREVSCHPGGEVQKCGGDETTPVDEETPLLGSNPT